MLQVVLSIFEYSVVCSLSLLQLYYNTLEIKCKRKMLRICEKRTMDTKAKRLRREGNVTGNVFGREMEGSLPVKIEKSAVEKLLKTSKGSQIMLDVDGQSYDVLIKEIQFNPLKGQVDEIDLSIQLFVLYLCYSCIITR